MTNHERLIVVTGGPGAGKSTLIAALEQLGHGRTVEAGRAIIQAQVAIGGSALPWADRALYAELMLSWEMRSYEAARQQRGLVFFDRAVPDIEGYLKLCDLPVPPHVQRAAQSYRYCRQVFVAPPWRDIYRQDAERKQDFAEAVRTCGMVADAYRRHGYQLVELPRVSVSERARFVLDMASSG